MDLDFDLLWLPKRWSQCDQQGTWKISTNESENPHRILKISTTQKWSKFCVLQFKNALRSVNVPLYRVIYDVFDAKICSIVATIINFLEFDKPNYALSIFKIHFLVKSSNF